jgi:hypothetical protein
MDYFIRINNPHICFISAFFDETRRLPARYHVAVQVVVANP